MEGTIGNVGRVLFALLLALSALQLVVASPVNLAGCAEITTVASTFTTKVFLPASTIITTTFKPGQSTATKLSVSTAAPKPVEDVDALGDSAGACQVYAATETQFVKQEPQTSLTVIYPCASPIPTLTPTIPYGKYSNPQGNPGSTAGNTIYPLSNTHGASAEACCNLCWFGMTYCIQAYWYSYEGCVVNQGTVTNGLIGSGIPLTGEGVTATCPQGTVSGLVYLPDSYAASRSTGDIAGPCGEGYADLP